MANIRTIRSRIRSVQNTAKVTRAMEMIAASKMRRSQQRLLASRPYSESITELMGHLASQIGSIGDESHPLMHKRDVTNVEIVHITPDRGLCGGLNANLSRNLGRFVLEQQVGVSVVSVGRKGRDFATRSKFDTKASFIDMGDVPSLPDTLAISGLVIEDYENSIVDEVYISYGQFISTTIQRPTIVKILPVESRDSENGVTADYIYEPNASEVLGSLLPRFVQMQIFHAILESIGVAL